MVETCSQGAFTESACFPSSPGFPHPTRTSWYHPPNKHELYLLSNPWLQGLLWRNPVLEANILLQTQWNSLNQLLLSKSLQYRLSALPLDKVARCC